MAVFKKNKVHLRHWFEKQPQWPCTVFSTQELFFSIYDLQHAITEDTGKAQKGFDIEISLSFVSAAWCSTWLIPKANLLPKLTQCPLGQLLPDFNAILCHGYKKQ